MNESSGKTAKLKKLLRTVIGFLVLLIGLITIPYPGPGWLIVFAGLAILAQDYPAAQRILDAAKKRYDAWQDWLKKQPLYVKISFWVLTCIVVVVTIWLLNGYGILNELFNLEQDWVRSPLLT